MSEQDDGQDKPFDPTPQKLLEARKKGEVARSIELQTAAGYVGLTLCFVFFGTEILTNLGEVLAAMLGSAESVSQSVFDGSYSASLSGWFWSVLVALAGLFLLPAASVLLTVLTQRAFVVAPSKLRPSLSKISIIKNLKQKFGRNGLFEFLKSSVKLLIYSLCLGLFIYSKKSDLLLSTGEDIFLTVKFLSQTIIEFFFIIILISVPIGFIDVLWQKFEHLRKNRMSRKEILDETKKTEGDPYLKQERRNRAQAIASQQMMLDVSNAEVVIVNPTHYAVALSWSRSPGSAPKCVAKGVDKIALKIREIAVIHAVPIQSDPPTARALFATLELGQEISIEHYAAVAEAIRFADNIRKRARNGVGR